MLLLTLKHERKEKDKGESSKEIGEKPITAFTVFLDK